MKKLFVCFLNAFLINTCLSLLVAFSGCSSMKDDSERNNHLLYGDIIEHFKKDGIDVSSVNPLLADVSKADSGLAFTINGRQIGIYKYNIKIKKQKEKLERIKKEGFLYLCAIKYPAIVNGSFVMVDYKNHPDEKKLVESFNSFSRESSWF